MVSPDPCNYLGVILSIIIVKNGVLISNKEIKDLINSLKQCSFNTIAVPISINYGLLTVDSQNLKLLLWEIKANLNCKILVIISASGELPLDYYSENQNLTYFDQIILNMKIKNRLMGEKDKINWIQGFYNINRRPVILSDFFLDLPVDTLRKYATGIFINNYHYVEHSSCRNFNLIINFPIDSIHPVCFDSMWNLIIFNKAYSIVHYFSYCLMDLFEILHCSIVLNDHGVKLHAIEKIKKLELLLSSDQELRNIPLNRSAAEYSETINENIKMLTDLVLSSKTDLIYNIN